MRRSLVFASTGVTLAAVVGFLLLKPRPAGGIAAPATPSEGATASERTTELASAASLRDPVSDVVPEPRQERAVDSEKVDSEKVDSGETARPEQPWPRNLLGISREKWSEMHADVPAEVLLHESRRIAGWIEQSTNDEFAARQAAKHWDFVTEGKTVSLSDWDPLAVCRVYIVPDEGVFRITLERDRFPTEYELQEKLRWLEEMANQRQEVAFK
jgi:hypothetical protein